MYVVGRHENRKVHLVKNVTLICIIEALCADGGLKTGHSCYGLVNELDWAQFRRYFLGLVSPLFSP